MEDRICMLLLTALLFLAACLKLKLKKKQGAAYSTGWTIQIFLFPCLCLVAAILFCLGTERMVVPVILLGILEEIVCWAIRRREKEKR